MVTVMVTVSDGGAWVDGYVFNYTTFKNGWDGMDDGCYVAVG